MSPVVGKLALYGGLAALFFAGYQAMSCEALLLVVLPVGPAAPTVWRGREEPGDWQQVPLSSSLARGGWPSMDPVSRCISFPFAARENARLLQQEFTGVPISLLLQLLVSATVSLLGGLQASGSFRPIRIADMPK